MLSFTKKEQIVILLLVMIIILVLGYKILKTDDMKVIRDDDNIATYDINALIENNKLSKSVEFENEDINPTNSIDNNVIIIHISGQVNKPGVIELKLGDRVSDAVKEAGGLTVEANLDKINLARRVEDEEKIYIPKDGEEMKTIESTSKELGTHKDNNKININTASIVELDSLPGIGKIKATKIIEYRKNKPFDSIKEVVKVNGIGEKTFKNIEKLITVN